MTSFEFQKELKRIHDHADEADKFVADVTVAVICNLAIIAVAYICIEVLL